MFKASLLILISISLSFMSIGYAANPCKPIALECMSKGYYKGGSKVGKGLIKDCVLPITEKKKSLPGINFDESVLQQCNTYVVEKMKETNR